MKTAVFISGRGSNLESILDFTKNNKSYFEVSLVFSNIPSALGLEKAKKAQISTYCISHKDYSNRIEHEKKIHEVLLDYKIELIALAGYLRLFSPWFIQKWQNRLVNIHPSLLPSFPGLHTHKQALECGVKYSGCTVFLVDEGVDTGKIIDQTVVPVLEDDTEKTLADRVLEQEHLLFPRTLNQIAKAYQKKE